MNKLGIGTFVLGAFLVGFVLIPTAEGAIGWNSFLKEVGFGHPEVYEVSDTIVIPAGVRSSDTITLRCEDGDWMDNTDNINFVTDPAIFEEGISIIHDTNAMFILDPASVATTGPTLSKRIGYTVLPELLGSGTPFGFPVEVTVTILCNSPTPSVLIGGSLVKPDNTSLLLAYTFVNSWWMLPIAIGIGAGVYLTKSRWNRKI